MEINNLKKELNELKRYIFLELLKIVGRVFIVVKYHEDVKIGRRGFLPEEKEKGIVLVFNQRMNFIWHEWGIEAKLVFGSAIEHCIIPVEHIIGIYSPEANTQFICLAESIIEEEKKKEDKEDKREKIYSDKTEKVVKVDFRKKKF